MTRLRAVPLPLLALLLSGAAIAYEEEPQLPDGEWMLLEGRTAEAVEWYRGRYAEDPSPELREWLAEALLLHGADLVAKQLSAQARAVLQEAALLTHDPERAGHIRHLSAYTEGRTTGHAVWQGNRALARGDPKGAHASYERALRDAQDDVERGQARTLLALNGLLRSALDEEGDVSMEGALLLWPFEASSTEDVQQFVWAATLDSRLRARLKAAEERLAGVDGKASKTLRSVLLCLMLETRKARNSMEGLDEPSARDLLATLIRHAERLLQNRRKRSGG
ncbi:MAG: hypothetical protein V3T14_05560 [Myxococcota bacterium]